MNRIMSEPARAVITLVALAALMLAQRLGWLGDSPVREALRDAANNGPNEAERDQITENYYEALVKVDREPEWVAGGAIRDWLRAVLGRRPMRPVGEEGEEDDGREGNWGSLAIYGGTIDLPEGFLEHALKPNWSGIHKGVTVTTNRWGHRDDDTYDQTRPAGVFRIALVGSSNCMGSGVEREDVFELELERLLNEHLAGGAWERYEVINFSVPRYHLLERVYVAENIAPSFEPNLILVAVTMRDLRKAMYASVARRVQSGRDLHFDFVREIVQRSHARPTDSQSRIEQRIQRFRNELALGALHELKTWSDASGVPVALLLLRLEVEELNDNLVWASQAAAQVGLPALEVFDAYEGRSGQEMYLIPGRDFHPTPAAHRALAEEIYRDLLDHPRLGALLRAGSIESEANHGG